MLTLSLETLRRLLAPSRRPAEAASLFLATRPASGPQRAAAADLIFRLRAWPQLPEAGRTAEVYRMLSVMSIQPVNRPWLLSNFRMPPHQLDALLLKLVAQGAVEVIDPARFAGRDACGA